MEYREFGKTKLKISKVGLGFMEIGSTSWKGKVEKSIEIIKAALEVGINFFDTAEIYGDGKSEQSLGLALREL
ncbi:MAG: aldo/keto reductase, partial [Caldisphaera sp.]|nr:aldo/keto reductase [Caldisphaera sp.]